ncbi:MAG: hypothetical protein AAGH76_17485 [Pseudomonadota bacterium]
MLRNALTVLLTALFAFHAEAMEITVGKQTIKLPVPDGYVELTPAMSPYYESMQAYQSPTNERHAIFIPEDRAEAVLNGVFLELPTYMVVESTKSIQNRLLTKAEFKQLRQILRRDIDALLDEVQEEVTDVLSKGDEALSDELDADISVQRGVIRALPVHRETESMAAFSLLTPVSVAVDEGAPEDLVIASTTIATHVRAKVLYLVVYGLEEDLEWTRGAAADWAKAVIAANSGADGEQDGTDASAPANTN